MFITGPARGIGQDAARRLAKAGATVALAGLEPGRLARLSEQTGGIWFEADVRDRDQIDRAVAGTVERFGGIDVVVANAGIAPVGMIGSIDPDDFERTIDVNLLGVWRTIRATLPHVTARRGYVLPVASLAAAVHLPLMAHYAAAKAGVSALADSLRMELHGSGTRVGCAYFGFIDTDMTRRAFDDSDAVTATRQVEGRVVRARSIPVEVAGRAIVRGIERRARWIVVPRFATPALVAPIVVQRAAEAVAGRRGVAAALRRRNGGPA